MPTTEIENSKKINNAEYAEIHLKGKDISNKYAQLQLAMWFENVKDAEIQLTKDMLQMVDEQKAAGMPPQRIINRLTNYAEDHGFESFLNESATNLWQAMKKVSQNNLYNSLPMANLYQWQMNPGAKHCEVCSRLNGQIKSIEEWREEGLPGHRQEGCYANCCCDLVKIKSHRTRDIRERNDTGIHKRYEPEIEQEELKEKATQEEIIKYNRRPKKNFYVEKLKEEFKWIDFSDIEKLNNITGYKDPILGRGQLMDNITANYAEQTYIALSYIKKTIGATALNKLDKIEARRLESGTGGEFCKEGGSNKDTVTVSMNTHYYGAYKNNNNKTIIGQFTESRFPNEFGEVLIHELWHYFFWKNSMRYDQEVLQFVKDNWKFINDRFPLISEYNVPGRRSYLEEEVHVRILAAYYSGTLNNKNYANADKYTKEHEMLIKKAHEIVDRFKKGENNG